jgi:hypothetical protein
MIRPILNRCFSVSHRSPSKPTVMPRGKLIRGRKWPHVGQGQENHSTLSNNRGLSRAKSRVWRWIWPFHTRRCKILRLFRTRRSKQANTFTWWLSTLEKAPTEEGAGQAKERFVDVGPFLITDTQATKLIQPGESKFHHQRHGPVHCHAQRFVWGAKGRCGGQISVTFGRASSSLVASRLCLVAVCSPLPSAP